MAQPLRLTVPLLQVGLVTIPLGAYSCLALLKGYRPFTSVPDVPLGLDAALSFAMALLIAFRVNRAYERWWEARQLWGTLVNVSRNLAVKVRELLPLSAPERERMSRLIIANCVGLKDHLRDRPVLAKLPGFEDDKRTPRHLPSYIVGRIYALFARWRAAGELSDAQLWVLDSEARILLDVCGGCERIKNTLMSVSWRTFTRQCIAIYLLVLPWGLVDDFGVWTIGLTMAIGYFVIAGEMIAQYVEKPFGEGEDHLDLDGVAEAIELSVNEILSDGPGPTVRKAATADR
jgi:putative membrane protein